MSRTTKSLVTFAFVCALTAACGQGILGRTGGEESILLGMAVPLSGANAAAGRDMEHAARMAVDEINGRGGVLGRKLQLKVEDDGCDPQTATSAANKLRAEGVVVSVGGYCSGATLPTLRVFGRDNIPMVIPAANSTELIKDRLKHVFLLNGTGAHQAAAAFRWLSEVKATKVMLFHDNTSYSKDIAVLTSRLLERPGGPEQVGLEVVTPGESDYGAAVANVLRKDPDFLYWTGYYQEGGLLIRQLRQAGYKGGFMGADGNVSDAFVEIAGAENAEGTFATMTQTPDTIDGADGWTTDYRKRFGVPPGPFSPQSYDAVRVAAEAIRTAGSTESVKIIAALEGMNGFHIFSGPLKFTPEHTLDGNSFVILAVKNGKYVLKDRLK